LPCGPHCPERPGRDQERTAWIVRLALRRPYTFVVVALLIAVLGMPATVSTPTDIFPSVDIPVVSVIWSYDGLSPEEMQDDITTVVERAMATAQYRNGPVDHLVVIDAERTLLTNQLAFARTVNQQTAASIHLIKALGGGWGT
jgi:hypothetical protein